MVVRRRYRAILVPLALYVLAGCASAFFVWHGINGQRGLKTKAELKQQIYALRDELAALKTERMAWEHRVSLMQPAAIDRDILEEEAAQLLNRVDRRDLIVFAKPRG